MSLLILFKLTTSVLFVVISLLLCYKGACDKVHIKIIGVISLIYSSFLFTRIYWFDLEVVLDQPHLLGIFSPLMFVPGPLFYLMTKNLLKNKTRFNKWEYLHFLPAVLSMVDMLPFYLLPAEQKFDIAQIILQNPHAINVVMGGYISPKVVSFFRILLFFGYFIFSVLNFIEMVKIHNKDKKRFNYWLIVTLLFFLIMKFNLSLHYLNSFQYYFSGITFPNFQRGVIMFHFLWILVFLIYNYSNLSFSFEVSDHPKPKVAYQQETNHLITKNLEENDLSEEKVAILQKKLKVLIEIEKVFLNKDLTSLEMAELLEIKHRALPNFLHENYGMSFKELISRERILMAQKEIENLYLDKYTLESLAYQVGFNSRITFFKAFKKETGLSPTEYFRKINA
jgi:AraC-like DNA-binding protein